MGLWQRALVIDWGNIRKPGNVKLIIGLLFGDNEVFGKAKSLLERKFGRIDFESETIEFVHTDYYAKEMGRNLKRKFLGFEKLLNLNKIYKVKIVTNSIEEKLLKHGKRTVNIDPGYLDMSKLVLFSTKDYSHRIHIDKGIFGEVTLFFKDGSYRAWEWTYPDYKTKIYIDIFNNIRENHKKEIGGVN